MKQLNENSFVDQLNVNSSQNDITLIAINLLRHQTVTTKKLLINPRRICLIQPKNIRIKTKSILNAYDTLNQIAWLLRTTSPSLEFANPGSFQSQTSKDERSTTCTHEDQCNPAATTMCPKSL